MARDSEPGVPIQRPPQGTNIVLSRIEVADLICPTTQMAPLFGEGTSDDEALVIEEHVPPPSGEHPALVLRDSLPEMEVVDLRMSGMVPIDDLVSQPVVALPLVARTWTPQKVIVIPPREAHTVQRAALGHAATVPLDPITATAAANDTTTPLPLAAITGVGAPAIGTAPTVPLELVPDQPVLPVAGAAPVAIDDSASDTTLKNRSASTALGVAPLESATSARAPVVVDTPARRSSPLPPTPGREPQTHPITTPEAHVSTQSPTLMDL
ncbi:hypothetical protein BH11MYX1_BH11MYX1_13560 [soil metagenome]